MGEKRNTTSCSWLAAQDLHSDGALACTLQGPHCPRLQEGVSLSLIVLVKHSLVPLHDLVALEAAWPMAM